MKRILATLIFFTRLPFWRIANIDKKYYERVVPLWPLAGWLTGGIMAGVFYFCQIVVPEPVEGVMPMPVAVIMALVSRILITGALHEDGFADFCDGMGGGTGRERILEIMKDSHIGTYGVLGLILYYLLLYNVLIALLPITGCLVFLIADSASKMVSSSIVWFLPYARKESEAKNKLIYTHTSCCEKILSMVLGLLPMVSLAALGYIQIKPFLYALCAIIIMAGILFRMMHRSIQGYTGDCCGATFIILELTCYLTLLLTI